MMILDQHCMEQRISGQKAWFLAWIYQRWAIRIGPTKAINMILSIIQQPQHTKHPTVPLKRLNKSVNGSLLNMVEDNYRPSLNICWNKALFNQDCKGRCFKDHRCPECAGIHSLEDCVHLAEKTRKRTRTTNYRWKSFNKGGHTKGPYNKFNKHGYNLYNSGNGGNGNDPSSNNNANNNNNTHR